jgi:hypothetical protein
MTTTTPTTAAAVVKASALRAALAFVFMAVLAVATVGAAANVPSLALTSADAVTHVAHAVATALSLLF